ncbi:hypothetical protein [Vibrio sp. SCSIO 43136]|uniref:hypothetical protein n=1 Tax=Vibrio sp. SCSIO 43136 TaxID=2819101 RepID=UPI002075CDD4|nr:hypothetical protein [Vibrio sp. SCSIO 43136]USD64209.1 hypothetical protein J4N39_08805 [Vibrio sp. SCSIO 43136]
MTELTEAKDGREDRSQKITALARSMANNLVSGDFVEQECPVTHRFADGCYLREILMPKGTLIVGKVHGTQHFNVILKGKCTVFTVDETKEIEAPHTFISEAGVQKVVLCHEDTIWQTLHVTKSTDLEEIEKEVIVETEEQNEILELVERARLCLGD